MTCPGGVNPSSLAQSKVRPYVETQRANRIDVRVSVKATVTF